MLNFFLSSAVGSKTGEQISSTISVKREADSRLAKCSDWKDDITIQSIFSTF